jgi:hypothetical protein
MPPERRALAAATGAVGCALEGVVEGGLRVGALRGIGVFTRTSKKR